MCHRERDHAHRGDTQQPQKKSAEAARAVWQREHLDPINVDDELRAAVTARRDADAQLDAAVAKARRLGRSWADTGAATGMTRQPANERWKDRA